MIKGGYYLKARQITESVINHAPPCVREIWDYFLRECNHQDRKVNGTIIKRGQCVRTYEDIRQALHWNIGWCKKMYTKNQLAYSMHFLKKHEMIHIQKTTRGLIITVVEYDYYQDPTNYKQQPKPTANKTDSKQTPDTINNNDNNDKKEIYIVPPKTDIATFFAYYCSALKSKGWIKRDLQLNHTRRRVIEQRLKDGYTLADLKACVDAFVADDWDRRGEFIELSYVIGLVRGVNMADKWLNKGEKPKKPRNPLAEA